MRLLKRAAALAAAMCLTFAMTMTASAGSWGRDAATGGWYWLYENGERPADEWVWLDDNADGVAECYYFDPAGFLVTGGQVNGWSVDRAGRWTVGGQVQTSDRPGDAISAADVGLFPNPANPDQGHEETQQMIPASIFGAYFFSSEQGDGHVYVYEYRSMTGPVPMAIFLFDGWTEDSDMRHISAEMDLHAPGAGKYLAEDGTNTLTFEYSGEGKLNSVMFNGEYFGAFLAE